MWTRVEQVRALIILIGYVCFVASLVAQLMLAAGNAVGLNPAMGKINLIVFESLWRFIEDGPVAATEDLDG